MKKIIIILCLIALNYTYSIAADNEPLPDLPPTFESTNVPDLDVDKNEKSLWQRIKSFFGFAEETKPVNALHDENQLNKDELKIEEKNPRAGVISNPNQSIQSENNANAKDDEVPDQLKLPENFGESSIASKDISDNTSKLDDKDINKTIDDENDPVINETKIETIEPIVKLPSDNEQASNNDSLPIPSYVDDSSKLSKYKQEFEIKKTSTTELPKIQVDELLKTNISNATDKDFGVHPTVPVDPLQLTFINNEAQVLILPNDDIVLGKLTEEAKLEQMDFKSYVEIFWEHYNKLLREPKRLELDRFVENYDEYFKQ